MRWTRCCTAKFSARRSSAPRTRRPAPSGSGAKFWATFRKAARYIPFADDLVAAYFCALDPATPHRVRAVLLAALAYFVLPFDAVPDFLAGIGFSDDVTVLVAAIAMVRAHITPAHREAARRALAETAPEPRQRPVAGITFSSILPASMRGRSRGSARRRIATGRFTK